VSTGCLSRRGFAGDVGGVIEVCTRLRQTVKRCGKGPLLGIAELSKKRPDKARRFISKHRKALALASSVKSKKVKRPAGNTLKDRGSCGSCSGVRTSHNFKILSLQLFERDLKLLMLRTPDKITGNL